MTAPKNQSPLSKHLKLQHGGDHYKSQSIQPLEYIEAVMSPSQLEGFLRGNVIKYISRYPEKAGLQDLLKAQHYLAMLVAVKEASIEKAIPSINTNLKGNN